MRIIDKNTDFYDYLQNVYYDPSTTFDRTDSFILTKEDMCDELYHSDWYRRSDDNNKFALLQVCNTFWLFLIEVTTRDDFGKPKSYSVELVRRWSNYDRERKLLILDLIDFGFELYSAVGSFLSRKQESTSEKIKKNADKLAMLVDIGNFRIRRSINKHTIYHGDNVTTEKHIPLLKACGISEHIDPTEIYTAFEEYFSLEKQSKERTESVGITDKEKAENHGFDSKYSFRGKRNG